jgi:hypothetical protein
LILGENQKESNLHIKKMRGGPRREIVLNVKRKVPRPANKNFISRHTKVVKSAQVESLLS